MKNDTVDPHELPLDINAAFNRLHKQAIRKTNSWAEHKQKENHKRDSRPLNFVRFRHFWVLAAIMFGFVLVLLAGNWAAHHVHSVLAGRMAVGAFVGAMSALFVGLVSGELIEWRTKSDPSKARRAQILAVFLEADARAEGISAATLALGIVGARHFRVVERNTWLSLVAAAGALIWATKGYFGSVDPLTSFLNENVVPMFGEAHRVNFGIFFFGFLAMVLYRFARYESYLDGLDSLSLYLGKIPSAIEPRPPEGSL